METIEIKIEEQKNDVGFIIVRHQKHSSEREKIFCDGWVKLVESIILASQTLAVQYSCMVSSIPKIDLKHAIIAWSSNADAEDGVRRLKVFKIFDQIIPKEYICTDGACFSYWPKSQYSQQVKRLQAIGLKLINEYGFTSEEVNDAFLSITEYFETQKTTGMTGFKPAL
jgi:hypothetical protein